MKVKFQTYVHNLFFEDSSKLICRKATTADDREPYALNMRREDEALKEVEVWQFKWMIKEEEVSVFRFLILKHIIELNLKEVEVASRKIDNII